MTDKYDIAKKNFDENIAIFQNQTFELGETIRKQIKNRLYRRGCLSWLWCAGETRILIV